MLWDIIRDFFVQYIFGGVSSLGEYYFCVYGNLAGYYQGEFDSEILDSSTTQIFEIGNQPDGWTYYIGLGDWLSTTATIITLIGICVALFFFIRWLFRLTSGLLNSWC